MSYFPPYIDASGVHLPTYEDRLAALVASYQSIFGPDVNLEISSPDYQLLSLFARALDDQSQLILADFNARNPQYATGAALDLLMPLYGLSRAGATCSTAIVQLTGSPNAVLRHPSGCLRHGVRAGGLRHPRRHFRPGRLDPPAGGARRRPGLHGQYGRRRARRGRRIGCLLPEPDAAGRCGPSRLHP